MPCRTAWVARDGPSTPRCACVPLHARTVRWRTSEDLTWLLGQALRSARRAHRPQRPTAQLGLPERPGSPLQLSTSGPTGLAATPAYYQSTAETSGFEKARTQPQASLAHACGVGARALFPRPVGPLLAHVCAERACQPTVRTPLPAPQDK